MFSDTRLRRYMGVVHSVTRSTVVKVNRKAGYAEQKPTNDQKLNMS